MIRCEECGQDIPSVKLQFAGGMKKEDALEVEVVPYISNASAKEEGKRLALFCFRNVAGDLMDAFRAEYRELMEEDC